MAATFPWDAMRQRPPGLWRYREALPLETSTSPVSLGEMLTPLLQVNSPDTTAEVYLKLDFLFPTGSFKDRGATVLLSQVRALGVPAIVEDSSGNAGAAIAAYAAAAGIQADIFVPASTSPAKISQIKRYGARLHAVPGNREDTTIAAQSAAQRAYYASHVWNPFFLEGTKTVAFEIWEQLGCRVPDWVVTPVGHGTLLLGVFKGFEYLRQAGMTRKLPQIVGVQAAACAPLAVAFEEPAASLPAIPPRQTLAEGIAITKPLRWRQIIAAVKDTDGHFLTISDGEITAELHHWASKGLLMEPTSATATAALRKLLAGGRVSAGDIVVAPLTGSGLKQQSDFWLVC